jgi:hypothetical protein
MSKINGIEGIYDPIAAQPLWAKASERCRSNLVWSRGHRRLPYSAFFCLKILVRGAEPPYCAFYKVIKVRRFGAGFLFQDTLRASVGLGFQVGGGKGNRTGVKRANGHPGDRCSSTLLAHRQLPFYKSVPLAIFQKR